MSNILARKRAEKELRNESEKNQSELNKQQTQAIQQRLDAQPVQDQDRGRGQDLHLQHLLHLLLDNARQTSGGGGLHSGY